MKRKIEELIGFINREGITELRKFLDTSDFYTAPCSTKFHLACEGGLAQHTANVVACAVLLNTRYDAPCASESVVIAALCHDFCKINFYVETNEQATDAQMRYLTSLVQKAGLRVPMKMNKTYASNLIDFMLNKYKKDATLPEFTPSYQVKDQLPLGHGEKSLFIAQQFISLTLDEALAIRWHMSTFDAGIHFDFPSGYAYREAVKQSKLLTIITLADMEATNLVEA